MRLENTALSLHVCVRRALIRPDPDLSVVEYLFSCVARAGRQTPAAARCTAMGGLRDSTRSPRILGPRPCTSCGHPLGYSRTGATPYWIMDLPGVLSHQICDGKARPPPKVGPKPHHLRSNGLEKPWPDYDAPELKNN